MRLLQLLPDGLTGIASHVFWRASARSSFVELCLWLPEARLHPSPMSLQEFVLPRTRAFHSKGELKRPAQCSMGQMPTSVSRKCFLTTVRTPPSKPSQLHRFLWRHGGMGAWSPCLCFKGLTTWSRP